MKLVSWNCQKGLNSKDKAKKLFELFPDIAIIQESFHPKEFNEDIRYEKAIWVGEEKPKGLGLCVLSLSKDYHLTQLVDQVKYDWIVPIKVTGKENFTLIAVWTKRGPGASYGNILYHALQEYENIIQDRPVIIMGDFNLDKRVASSYSGVGGFKKMMSIFEHYGLKSIYHINNKEEFGSESVMV
ncbi:MAG: endonuclease/exonuclease/phosphatase family protein [Bacillota bacterium]